MILILLIIIYIKDCKEIGKENLAVSLSERLINYIVFILLPIILAIVYKKGM